MEKSIPRQYRRAEHPLIRVVLFGPESTGKTTLSRQLAEYYQAPWVPEFARDFLQDKWDRTGEICSKEDLIPIAIGQVQSENEAALKAENLLFCDTDVLETLAYSYWYFGADADPRLEAAARLGVYDLYLLTYIDTPWASDDLRDQPDTRPEMFSHFKDCLERFGRNFVILKGNPRQRFDTAVSYINELIHPPQKHDILMDLLTEKDLEQLKMKGISREQVGDQVKTFQKGIPFVNLSEAAVVPKGISRFSESQQLEFQNHFDQKSQGLNLLKFVPASGAASRMFKALFAFLEAFDPHRESLTAYWDRTGDKATRIFVEGIENFPFYREIKERISERATSADHEVHLFVQELLTEEGLNYGFYPKGLLPFHSYAENATPFEEHLKEAAFYAKSGGKASLHFTISPQHEVLFKAEEDRIVHKVQEATSTQFNISYSFQKPSTDTLAVDKDNLPFRNSDGSILFRPGGHGALIENLNEVNADIVFIKNIDNVVTEEKLEVVGNSKKMLAGLLLRLQERAFDYARALEQGGVEAEKLQEMAEFMEHELNVPVPQGYSDFSGTEKQQWLSAHLNRPIRICGMVKNEGEPGGGPFWIKDSDGKISLQIIESAQIDRSNTDQNAILQNSTHFNPVDLVCGLKDHKGEKYDLLTFVDKEQGFITEKTKEGKELKALELPGLWNGAMAFWNTIFVEVPLVTFNPVKTVNDLLKPSHQV